MTAGPKPIFTNVCTYKAIADQAYREMAEDLEQNVRRNPQGRERRHQAIRSRNGHPSSRRWYRSSSPVSGWKRLSTF